MERVDLLYGTDDWQRVQRARDKGWSSPDEYRSEMVNLFRWRLHAEMSCALAARVPMTMPNNVAIYDMVFATDEPVGRKIVTHVYGQAAEREPVMMQEAKARARNARDADRGTLGLFDVTGDDLAGPAPVAWEPDEVSDPAARPWW